MFLSEVAGSSLGGMYALPLQIGAVKVGALDLHCAAGAPLGAADFADAVVISELVTAVLLNSDPDGRISATLGSWWNQPLSTREVHQATGMVMAQLGGRCPIGLRSAAGVRIRRRPTADGCGRRRGQPSQAIPSGPRGRLDARTRGTDVVTLTIRICWRDDNG